MDYKIPTSADAPALLHSIIVEDPEPGGPFGAKGAGEIGLNAVPAAIANAVAAALGGVSPDLPLTGERILARIVEAGDAA
jgi:CO/xanthine dehydrogenase Mo-binding subunit